jgi:hypothetical protein
MIRRPLIMAAAVVLGLVLVAAPALGRAEGGSTADDDLDAVTNFIDIDGTPAASGSGGGGAGGGNARYAYVREIVEGAGFGCPDGTIERVWQGDRTTGERTLVYAGCIRPRPPRDVDSGTAMPPSAASIRETLPVETGDITADPHVTGLTGLETRFGYQGPATFGPFTTTLDGYEVTANLRVTDYAWSTGDGGRYTGPAITHTYAGTGTFTVSVTLTWRGGYTFRGPDGSLGSGALSLTTTAMLAYQVDEVQAVGVG